MPFGRDSWPEMDAALRVFAAARSDFRFVPRNFLLDERVNPSREGTYRGSVTLRDLVSEDAWRGAHEEYLSARVFVKRGAPETFTDSNSGSLLSGIEPRQHLIHVERADAIAHSAAMPVERFLEVTRDFLVGRTALRDTVTDILGFWLRSRDLRPVFSGFWGEFSDLFEPVEARDWPDRCRDRLGIAHLTPTPGRPIPVILFRHPLRRVIELRTRIPGAVELVAVPTVLDSSMFPAFCPAPHETPYGHVLDLSSDLPYTLRAEVVHPMPDYRPEDIFRVGQITSAPARTIGQARGLHLSLLRGIISRDDYATQTNGDLL